MTRVGMPYNRDGQQHATTASLTYASSGGAAVGAAYKLPRSMPRARVTLRSWAPLCCLN